MNNIDLWNIENSFNNELTEYININCNIGTKLLDLSKENYSLYEKFVYDMAIFHFKRLNIEITNNHYIEFWSKNKFNTHKLHLDCDEYQKKNNLNYLYPLLSCVTYFNDNDCPTIITDIDLESYKYKEFEKQTNIYLSFPKCNKHITFNGSFFHGSTSLKECHYDARNIIAINLWDKKPTNIEYYTPNTDTNIFYNKNKTEFIINRDEEKTITINVNKNIINYDFFENLLYSNPNTLCYCFDNLIENINKDSKKDFNLYKIMLDNTIEKKEIALQLKNKYGDIMNDINEIMNETIKLKYNRFLQRFCYNKIFTPDMCRFIINECEKYAVNNGGWTTKRHKNYPTTDLPVEKITNIFGLVLETMNTVIKKIKKSYGLNDNMTINIQDLFVVKYKDNDQNHLDMHHDGSFLSFNILLSDTQEFEGGGTYFDDGLTGHLEQGDILIHSSRIKHAGLPITKGTRYLLVGFLNINLSIEK